MPKQLMCGAARGKITPEPEWLTDLRGLGDRQFGGVLDDLFVRVIALSNGETQALIISFDLDKVPSPDRLIRRLTLETGIEEPMITMTAIHTHTAPITGKRPDEGPNDLTRKPFRVQEAARRYEMYLETILLETAKTAISRRVLCKMGVGTGRSFINIYRNQWYTVELPDGQIRHKCALGADPGVDVDRTAVVLKFEDMQSRTLACFINYPVHCCILHTNRLCSHKLGISADLAGYVCAGLEKQEDGCIAVWTSGAAGDINPLMQQEMYYPNETTGDMQALTLEANGYEFLQMMGARHLADIGGILRRIRCDQTAAQLCGAVEWSKTPGRAEGTSYEVRLHMLRIGGVFLFGASGELYSAYARWLKRLFPGEMVVVMNHEASLFASSGYIFDDETLLLPDADLPGLDHTNMQAGYFIQSLTKHARSMYLACLPEH